MSDLTRDTRGPPPKGFNEFMRVLKAHNVPMSAIGSARRRDLFDEKPPATTSSRGDEFSSASSSHVLPSIAPSVRSRRPLSIEDFQMPRQSRRISAQGPKRNYARTMQTWKEKSYK